MEHIGEASPHADVETISVAWAALCDMGLDAGWKPVILLNTLGDEQTYVRATAAAWEAASTLMHVGWHLRRHWLFPFPDEHSTLQN